MTATIEHPRTAHSRVFSTLPERKPTRLRVAIAGCGVVGNALLDQLVTQREVLALRHGVRIDIVGVLVRNLAKQRSSSVKPAWITDDIDAFLALDADVIVEAIGGAEPAGLLAEWTLSRGKHFVTANKALVSSRGTSLNSLAREQGGSLRFDAAVGGGVPILRILEESLGASLPQSVRGIVNGTSNFVLSQIERGDTLEGALEKARRAGFAEADATRDLDGRDAADKIRLIAWSVFGVAPEELRVDISSLLPDPSRFVRIAGRAGCRVRQIAECAVVDAHVVASVRPVLVREESVFASTIDEGNHVEVSAGWRSPLCASGPGAGGLPTATALLSDLVAPVATYRRQTGAPSSASDTRCHSWTVEIRGASALLHRSITDCGLVHVDAQAEFAWTNIAIATAGEIAALVDLLTLAGAEPIALQLDAAPVNAERAFA